MSAIKRYLLRDSTGHFFKSVSGDGCEAHFTADPDGAYQFSKDAMASFRREYDYIKGRVVLASRSRAQGGNTSPSENFPAPTVKASQ